MSGAALAAAGAAVAAAAATAQLDGVDVAGWMRARAGAREEQSESSGSKSGPRAARGAAAAVPLSRVGGTPGWFPHAVVGILGACTGLMLGGLTPGAILAIGAAGASVLRERRRRVSRRAACERAAPSLARSLADALRGGASVRTAMAQAAGDRSVPAALREALSELSRGVHLGAPIEGALETLAGRGGPTLRLLCGAVVMHLESGGALATELERLAADGETALRVDEDRVAATAQARATVRVVAALPVLALIGAELASRDFLPNIAAKPAALTLLMVGLLLEVAAILAARAIVGDTR